MANLGSTMQVYSCPLQRLSEWGAVGHSPATTAQQISFWAMGLMLFDKGHAKDVPLLVKITDCSIANLRQGSIPDFYQAHEDQAELEPGHLVSD